MLHGSGYIAAFVGGMMLGYLLKHRLRPLIMPAEGIGGTMSMLTWLIFGVSVIGTSIECITPDILLYSLLSLTVIRVVPICLSLLGSGERLDSRLFLGWFGPRGLASIVFASMVLNAALPGGRLIATVVTCTVGLSLIAHGVSANPLAAWMSGREKKAAVRGQLRLLSLFCRVGVECGWR
jgi:NhaP-type Na+/H+ or K+/H+ antiporter